MKILKVILLIMMWTPVPPALADVEVSLGFKNTTILKFERVDALVKIKNEGNKPFVMYKDGMKVGPVFNIEVVKNGKREIPKSNDEPILGRIVLMDGDETVERINLGRWFNLGGEGIYFVRAEIRTDGYLYSSEKKVIRVVPGLSITQVTKALPGASGTRLTYSVRYLPRDRKEYAFLSIDDLENQVNYGVFELGTIVRYKKPSIKLESGGLVVVRHQGTPTCTVLTSVQCTKEGSKLLDQSYFLPSGEPFPSKKRAREKTTARE